jgi:hypothetical protein
MTQPRKPEVNGAEPPAHSRSQAVQDHGDVLTPAQQVLREWTKLRTRWFSTSGIDKKGRYYFTGKDQDGQRLPPLPTMRQRDEAAARAAADAVAAAVKAKRAKR